MTYDEALEIALFEHNNGGTRLVEQIARLLLVAYHRGREDERVAIQEASKPKPEPSKRVYGVALFTRFIGHETAYERVLWGVGMLGDVPERVALEQQQYWEYYLAVPARVVWVDYRWPSDLPSVIYPSDFFEKKGAAD